MDRRTALGALGNFGALYLAGCMTRDGDEPPEGGDDEGELRVVTDEAFVRPTDAAGRWLRTVFEEEYPDAELVWVTPEAGVDLYIRQARQDPPIGEDVYLGLSPTDLARVDEEAPEQVFRRIDRDRLGRSHRVRSRFRVEDPEDRALPYLVDYVCLLYDGTEFEGEGPTSLEKLREPAYRDALLAQDARTSDLGRSFLYWTVHEYGSAVADYWRALRRNGIQLFDGLRSSYAAYIRGEGAATVARASQRVAASAADRDMTRHQLAYPDGRGYVASQLTAIFADSDRTNLAYGFVDMLLSNTVQTELALRTDRFPALASAYVDLPERYDDAEPPEGIALSVGDLRGDHRDWVDEWANAVESTDPVARR